MKIFLKKVGFSDIEFLWYLRNQSEIYKYSKKDRPVDWKEHIDYIMPIILGQIPKDLFVIYEGVLPVGQIRFSYQKNKEAKISISVLKEFRGKGIGGRALKMAINLVKRAKKVKTFIANIHKKNTASQKFFEKLNFKLKEKKGNWLTYILCLT